MGLIKSLIWIVLIIVAIAFFLPDTYDQGKNWVKIKIQDFLADQISDEPEEIYNFTVTDLGKDYGKILGVVDCTSDSMCAKYFEIDGIKCSDDKTCYVEVVE